MTTTVHDLTAAGILTELHRPGEHTSLCTLLPGDRFRAAVIESHQAPAQLPQDRNVWFGVNPVRPDAAGRGTAEDVTRWAALYADLDVKPGSLPDLDAARSVVDTLAAMLGTAPAYLIASGHGLQPVWQVDPDDPAADTTDLDRRAEARALSRRWGRLVARVAADYGAQDVDSVFDLARVLRAPGTVNHKADPLPATATATGGHPLTVADVAEALEGYGVSELPEDRETLGAIISPPADWQHGETTCPYVRTMVDAWATDTPGARHPWLLSQATRLAAAHRAGCITAEDHQTAWHALAARFRHLLTHQEPARDETPREVQDAAAWGTARAATFTPERLARELGDHRHGDPLDLDGIPANLTTLPAPVTGVTPEEGSSPVASATPEKDFSPVEDSTPDGDSAEHGAETTETAEPPPGSSWGTVDLTETVAGLLAGTIKRHAPTIGQRDDGACLFYAGKVNGVAGASGSGKTWTALHAVAQQLATGHATVYVDLEDDDVGMVGRLLDLGADPEHLAGPRRLFHYVRPEESFLTESARHLAAVIREHRPALVVIDSTGESMALDGAKPNDDDDTARWFRRLPTAVANAGPAVVVLDHVVKADDGGLWPIGSQRKRAAITGAQYMQLTVRPFAKGQPGAAKLVCAKDRHGNYRTGQRVADLSVTPDDGDGVHITMRAPSDATTPAAETFRPTALMEKVSHALETAGEPLSFRGIDDRVKGKQQHIRTAVDVLVTEGHVARTPGPNRSTLHTAERPYRQTEDPKSDAYTGASVGVSPSLEGEGGDTHRTGSGIHPGDTGDTPQEALDINENDGIHPGRHQGETAAGVSPVYPTPETPPCTTCGEPVGPMRAAAGMTTCADHYRPEATA